MLAARSNEMEDALGNAPPEAYAGLLNDLRAVNNERDIVDMYLNPGMHWATSETVGPRRLKMPPPPPPPPA